MKLVRASALLAIGIVTGTALAQQAPPTENKGVSATPLSAFDLSKQGLKDWDQRQMRVSGSSRSNLVALEPSTAMRNVRHSRM